MRSPQRYAKSQLHVFEPGGAGGVYQSVLGQLQSNEFEPSAELITVHTSSDAEATPALDRVQYCRCMRWRRTGSDLERRLASLSFALFRTLPHVVVVSRRSIIHIEGQFGHGLYVLFVLLTRIFSRKQVFTPHNIFSRGGGKLSGLMLTLSLRIAEHVRVYNKADYSRLLLTRAATKLELGHLKMYIPPRDVALEAHWKDRLAMPTGLCVGFIGQLRADKNPLMLIEAVADLATDVSLVFAGEDKGALDSIELASSGLPARHRIVIEPSFVPLEDMVAIARAVDVIVCPYAIASQSGVAALAQQVGTRVVSSNTGGLPEQSDFIFDATASSAAQELRAILQNIAAERAKNGGR